MSGLGVSALGRGAPRVAAMFQSAPAPFVLLLDDLHELRSPACHDVLAVVLSGVPAGSQVVTASRAEQPHLPRLRAQGDAVELRAADLALDARAAEEVFAAARVPITPEQASEVAERTEGWPVGLHLAAMIARDTPQEPWVVSGDDRYVAEYLQREALSTVDPRMHEFLRRTAVLERFNAPLCDAVVGEPGGRERLEALGLSNSFLIPLDRTAGVVPLPPPVPRLPARRAPQVEPELVEHLHARAADWYQAHGSPAMAVEHLLSAGRAGPLCAARG